MELAFATRVYFPPDSILLPTTTLSLHSLPSPSISQLTQKSKKLLVSRLSFSSSNRPPHDSSSSAAATVLEPRGSERNHWVVVMEKPGTGVSSKLDAVDHFVRTLAKILGSERDAQMCIYGVSWETHFGFCCDMEEEDARSLAVLPGVVSVKHENDFESLKKEYNISFGNTEAPGFDPFGDGKRENIPTHEPLFTSETKRWIVRMKKPGVAVVTKPQMVDYYAQILMKVLGNEQDSQMCMYHVSWQTNYGFCCEIDEDSARDLAGVPGVISVHVDVNFDTSNKNYEGVGLSRNQGFTGSDNTETTPIRTKRLFVTGLSFYTSEKTLRAAFEGFGELVELKIIMDKISKRSKGYAFIEYTTEEAAAAALKEMNGKIINGWMIVVDVAKTNPPRYSRERSRMS